MPPKPRYRLLTSNRVVWGRELKGKILTGPTMSGSEDGFSPLEVFTLLNQLHLPHL